MRPAFLERFEHVTVAGDEKWRATCPLCSSRRALSIAAGDSRWMAACYAAPKSKVHVKDALAIVGLRFDDLLYESEWRGGEYTSTAHEPPPTPVEEEEERESQIRQLLRLHREKRLAPAVVVFPALPANASPAMRAVADDIRLRVGLRVAGDDYHRPLPYAGSEAVGAGIVTTQEGGADILRRLVRCRFIRHVETLQNGTYCYAPPDWSESDGMPVAGAEAGVVPVEREHVVAGAPVEPLCEVPDEAHVGDAVVGGGGLLRVGASVGGAPVVEHAAQK